MLPHLVIQPSAQALVERAAEHLVAAMQESLAARGAFSFALSGGSTPKALYQLLASAPWREQIEWSKVHIFFGDERAVPPDDEYSNYRMACEALLEHVPIPRANVHRMSGEWEDLNGAARDYEERLREYAPLDLVLLGMGDDGHTASLFPHSPALSENEKLCVATPVASLEPHVRRLTVTFPAINAARRVWLLVTGSGKAARLQQVLAGMENGARDVESTPIQGVAPAGEYLWLLDEAAAHLLSGRNRNGARALSAP